MTLTYFDEHTGWAEKVSPTDLSINCIKTCEQSDFFVKLENCEDAVLFSVLQVHGQTK